MTLGINHPDQQPVYYRAAKKVTMRHKVAITPYR